MADVREISEEEKVPQQFLKLTIKYLLTALDFLHAEAQVVHTGELFFCYSDEYCGIYLSIA